MKFGRCTLLFFLHVVAGGLAHASSAHLAKEIGSALLDNIKNFFRRTEIDPTTKEPPSLFEIGEDARALYPGLPAEVNKKPICTVEVYDLEGEAVLPVLVYDVQFPDYDVVEGKSRRLKMEYMYEDLRNWKKDLWAEEMLKVRAGEAEEKASRGMLAVKFAEMDLQQLGVLKTEMAYWREKDKAVSDNICEMRHTFPLLGVNAVKGEAMSVIDMQYFLRRDHGVKFTLTNEEGKDKLLGRMDESKYLPHSLRQMLPQKNVITIVDGGFEVSARFTESSISTKWLWNELLEKDALPTNLSYKQLRLSAVEEEPQEGEYSEESEGSSNVQQVVATTRGGKRHTLPPQLWRTITSFVRRCEQQPTFVAGKMSLSPRCPLGKEMQNLLKRIRAGSRRSSNQRKGKKISDYSFSQEPRSVTSTVRKRTVSKNNLQKSRMSMTSGSKEDGV